MCRKIFGAAGAALFLLAVGIVGGVEHGEPLGNMLWAFAALGAAAVCARISGWIE